MKVYFQFGADRSTSAEQEGELYAPERANYCVEKLFIRMQHKN